MTTRTIHTLESNKGEHAFSKIYAPLRHLVDTRHTDDADKAGAGEAVAGEAAAGESESAAVDAPQSTYTVSKLIAYRTELTLTLTTGVAVASVSPHEAQPATSIKLT